MRSSSLVPIAVLLFFAVLIIISVVFIIDKSNGGIKEFQILISSSFALIAAAGGICAVFINQNRIDERNKINIQHAYKEAMRKQYDEERIAVTIMKSNIAKIKPTNNLFVFDVFNQPIEIDNDDSSVLFKVNPVVSSEYLELIAMYNSTIRVVSHSDRTKLENRPELNKGVVVMMKSIEERKLIVTRFLDLVVSRNLAQKTSELRPISDETASNLRDAVKLAVSASKTEDPSSGSDAF